MHVYWVEISWVLGVIYVLAEDRKSFSFIHRSFGKFGVDDVPCVVGISVMASRGTSMIALILVPRPGLATRVVALICFPVVLLFSRGSAVVGNRWSRVLPPNLSQGISGQALNFTNLRSVRQGLHQYSYLGQVDQRTVECIVVCFI